jgi:hypothetical protein
LTELGESFEEAVGEAGFVARETGKSVILGGVDEDRGAEHVDFGLLGVLGEAVGILFVVLVGIEEAVGEDGGFDARDALQAPFGVGDLADQGAFEGGGGLEVGVKVGEELLELGGVLAGDDGVVGAEAVLESVLGGGGFAFGGTGPGAEFCVLPVGSDLVLGWHDDGFSPGGKGSFGFRVGAGC